MNIQTTDFFRQEVIKSRADRLHGTIAIAIPSLWQAIGFLLLATLIAAICFIALSHYARVETVPGTIVLDTGVAKIMPSRGGLITMVAVREGQHVRAGDVLVQIRSEDLMPQGGAATDAIRSALADQNRILAGQALNLRASALAEQQRFGEQIKGLGAELASLDAQLAVQHELVDAGAQDLAAVQRIVTRGFISRRDVTDRETTLLLRRQQLSQLEQARASKLSAMAETRRSMAQASAASEAQIASAQSSRAALGQQVVQADANVGYRISAPVDGVVTAVTARVGQRTVADQSLLLVVPASSHARAELLVPTEAAGFLASGQEVRLTVDAFPYQRFGTITARLAEISTAAVVTQSPKGPAGAYLVSAALPESYVRAFGRKQPLLPGMTLTARVVTDRRSLLQWLFEPLLAIGER